MVEYIIKGLKLRATHRRDDVFSDWKKSEILINAETDEDAINQATDYNGEYSDFHP